MKRLALLVVPALALAPFTGCSASVAGKIDGDEVATLFSALYTERESDAFDEDGEEATLTSVSGQALSVLDGCAQGAKRQLAINELHDQFLSDLKDAQEDADEDAIKDAHEARAQGEVDYDVANLPTDYWVVVVGASSLDDGAIDGGKAEIAFDEAQEDDVIGSLGVCRVNDHPSVDEDDNDIAFVEADADCWGVIEADVEIVKWEKETVFEVKATATLGDFEDFDPLDPDDEPKDVGDVEITLSAGHCAPLQEALEELDDIIEDAQDG